MNFNALEFKADFKKSDILRTEYNALTSFIYMSNVTDVAALLFELLLSLHVAVYTFIFA